MAFQMGQVFPFPMMADNPMMLSAMSGMQQQLDGQAASALYRDPYQPYRDPYQPYMIGTFNNPYFDHNSLQPFHGASKPNNM